MGVRGRFVCALVLAGLAVPGGVAEATPSDRDPTFATGGVDQRVFGEGEAAFLDTAVLPDGRVLAVGYAIGPPNGLKVLLARYTATGQLDPTFGSGGSLILDLDECGSRADRVALLPDGRFVVAGVFQATPMFCGYTPRAAVARFNADGTLDTSFNGTGKVTLSDAQGGLGLRLRGIAVQPDLSTVVAGTGGLGISVARLTPGGALDTSFSPDAPAGVGSVTPTRSTTLELGGLVLDAAGRPVVGASRAAPSGRRLLAARFTPGGALDTSFAAAGSQPGVALTGVDGTIGGVQPTAGDSVLLAGTTTAGDDIVLTRLTSGGAVDGGYSTPGVAGVETTSVPEGAVDVRDLTLLPSGAAAISGRGPGGVLLARYTAGGVPDATFNPTGTPANVRLDAVDGLFGFDALAVAATPSGKLVAAGIGSGDRTFVARYGSDGAAPVGKVNATWPRPDGATSDRPLRPGQLVTFDSGGSIDPDGVITSREWSIEEGPFTAADKVGAIASGVELRARLRLRDDDGAETITPLVVRPTPNPAPSAQIDGPARVAINTPFTLDAGGSTDDGAVDRYVWELNGDSLPDSAAKQVTVQRGSVGPHEFKVTVTDDEGASRTAVKTVTVDPPSFTAKPEAASAGRLDIVAGTTESARILVKRTGGGDDPLTITSSVPQYLSATTTPAQLGAAAEQTFDVLITPDAVLGGGEGSVLVTIQASAAEGGQKEVIPIPVRVQPAFDAAIRGIEVTQGTQDDLGRCHLAAYFVEPLLPPDLQKTTDGLCSKSPSLPVGTQEGKTAFAATYKGVPLVAEKRTIVRVFASLRKNDTDLKYTATLRGTRGGTTLGVITARTPPRELQADPDNHVTYFERGRDDEAIVFDLPASWTRSASPLTLQADLQLSGAPPGPVSQCVKDICAANDHFRLSGLTFGTVGKLYVGFVRIYDSSDDSELRVGDKKTYDFTPKSPLPKKTPRPEHWPPVSEVRELSATQLPLPDDGLITHPGYMARYRLDAFAFDDDLTGQEKLYAARDWLQDQVDDGDLCTDYCPAQIQGIASMRTSNRAGVSVGNFLEDLPASISYWNRLQTVTHEFIHGWDVRHSHGTPCATEGQEGEATDAAGRGYFQGIKLDPRPGQAGTDPAAPYVVTAPAPTSMSDLYDVMSYCAGSDLNSWVSPPMWRKLIAQRAKRGGGATKLVRASTVPPVSGTATVRQAGVAPVLAVHAVESATGVRINLLSRRARRVLGAATASPYAVRVRDRAGAVLATAPLGATKLDDDAATLLKGEVPAAAGAAVVEVLRDGAVVARKEASPATPTLRLLAPTAASVVRGRPLTVRWQMRDADAGSRLMATVLYSPDGGRRWRNVAITDGSSATIPRDLLRASRRALVRVGVSDGFNEVATVSAPFRVEARSPTPVIEQPARDLSVTAGAPLVLAGSAIADGGTRLPDSRLTWFAGKARIGRGTTATAMGLAPGRTVIRLVARDAAGRAATATRTVRVTGATPVFTTYVVPARASRTARAVTLRLATSYPVTVRIGTRTYALTPTPRAVRVPVKPGRTPLRLRLTAGTGSQRVASTVVIPRR